MHLIVATFALAVVGNCFLFWLWRSKRNSMPPISPPIAVEEFEVDPLEEPEPARKYYDYFLVLDVEATCVEGTDLSWPNEIIEWPVLLLGWDNELDGTSQLKVVDEFRSFVRPTWRSKLSPFCCQLTGITQAEVDAAQPWKQVLKQFNRWLRDHNLVNLNGKKMCRFTWCTDGPYDIRDFVTKQCFISGIDHPNYMLGDIIDVKLAMREYLESQEPVCFSRGRSCTADRTCSWAAARKTRSPRAGLRIPAQLARLGLPSFEGRQHSGIDDARNISRVVIELARRGFTLRSNYTVRKGRRWPWMGRKPGQILAENIISQPATPAVAALVDEW